MKRNRGISIFELVVVVALASTVLLTISLLMQGTRRTFQKGTDMLNSQVLLENIVDNLRSDIRILKQIRDCNDHLLVFTGEKGGREIEITYTYDDGKKTLFRKVSDHPEISHDFHGARQIAAFSFQPKPSLATFTHMNVVMRIISEETKGSPPTSLSFVSQFFAPCHEKFFLKLNTSINGGM